MGISFQLERASYRTSGEQFLSCVRSDFSDARISRAVLHDPDIYPEPDRFYPERFIRDGKLNPDVLDPASLVFGFGRR